MKKLFLIVLLVFSLQASEVICEDSWSRYLKYYELFMFANERRDVEAMKDSSASSLKYIERTIASCGAKWKHKDNALIIRSELMRFSDALKKH